MELDLPKFIWASMYSRTHWLRPRNYPPPPAFGFIYEGAIGQLRETTSLCNPLRTLTHLSQGQGVAVLGPAHVEGFVLGVAAAPERAGRDLTVVRLHPAHRTVLSQHQVLNRVQSWAA
jgi:hypothetical protein